MQPGCKLVGSHGCREREREECFSSLDRTRLSCCKRSRDASQFDVLFFNGSILLCTCQILSREELGNIG